MAAALRNSSHKGHERKTHTKVTKVTKAEGSLEIEQTGNDQSSLATLSAKGSLVTFVTSV